MNNSRYDRSEATKDDDNDIQIQKQIKFVTQLYNSNRN